MIDKLSDYEDSTHFQEKNHPNNKYHVPLITNIFFTFALQNQDDD